MSMHSTRRTKDYLAYALAFACTCFVVYAPFVLAHKSFIWIGETNDGLCQHYSALVYEGIWLRDIAKSIASGAPEVRLWDFSMGYGSDVITTLSYYALGDPLNLLTALVPSRYTEWLYCALVLVRLFLAGAALIVYSHKMGYAGTKVVAGAMAYDFCSYALGSAVRHPFFVNPMIYLPLLLVGIERIYRERRPTLYIATICLSALSNFYFFYMLAIAVAGYALARFFTLPHEHPVRELVQYGVAFVAFALVGAACAAILLLPTVGALLGSSRAGSKPLFERWYDLLYYQTMVSSYFKVAASGEHWRCLGYASPAVLGICYLIVRPRRHPVLTGTFVVLTFCLLVPDIASALNGFTYAANRWVFIYSLFAAVTLVVLWDDLISMRRSDLAALVVCAAAVVVLAALGAHLTHDVGVCIQLGLFVLALCCVVYGRREHGKHVSSRTGRASWTSVALMALVMVSVATGGVYLYSVRGKGYVREFLTSGLAYRAITETPFQAIEEYDQANGVKDGGLVRVESDSFTKELDTGDKLFFRNGSMFTDLSCTQYFWSLSESKLYDYYVDMELADTMSNRSTYLEKRAIPIALASVDYEYITGYTPLGFQDTYVEEIKEATHKLSIGYTYQSVMARSEYEKLDVAKRQQATLQTAIVDDEVAAQRKDGIELGQPTYTDVVVPHTKKFVGDIREIQDGVYEAAAGSQIVFEFEGREQCETYLHVVVDSIEPGVYNGNARMSNWARNQYIFAVRGNLPDGKGMDRTFRYRSPYNRYYGGTDSYLVNMYYHEEPLTSIVLTIPVQGRYHFDSLEVICQPMADFDRQVEALGAHALEDVQVQANGLSGTIHLDTAQVLTIAMPNTTGWTAEVDGTPVELFDVNTMYMGMMLEPGDHVVQLRYCTHLLPQATLLSLVGLALAAIIYTCERRMSVASSNRA